MSFVVEWNRTRFVALRFVFVFSPSTRYFTALPDVLNTASLLEDSLPDVFFSIRSPLSCDGSWLDDSTINGVLVLDLFTSDLH